MMTRKERKLVRRLRARDEDAFTELVHTHQHKVFNVVYQIVRNRSDAEEVSQEVFIAVFKNIDKFRGESLLSTWIYRIATNHARNRVKYHARRNDRAHQSVDDTSDGAMQESPLSERVPGPHETATGNELEKILEEGLASLGEIHRTMIVLREVENLSYDEIAEIMELPAGTVKSRLARARTALKEYVESRYNS